MIRVSNGMVAAAAVAWLAVTGAGAVAQTPEPPKAVPAEARDVE